MGCIGGILNFRCKCLISEEMTLSSWVQARRSGACSGLEIPTSGKTSIGLVLLCKLEDKDAVV